MLTLFANNFFAEYFMCNLIPVANTPYYLAFYDIPLTVNGTGGNEISSFFANANNPTGRRQAAAPNRELSTMQVVLQPPSSDQTIAGIGLFDSQSSGNCFAAYTLPIPKIALASDPQFALFFCNFFANSNAYTNQGGGT
jgi:hypothetical protein